MTSEVQKGSQTNIKYSVQGDALSAEKMMTDLMPHLQNGLTSPAPELASRFGLFGSRRRSDESGQGVSPARKLFGR